MPHLNFTIPQAEVDYCGGNGSINLYPQILNGPKSEWINLFTQFLHLQAKIAVGYGSNPNVWLLAKKKPF